MAPHDTNTPRAARRHRVPLIGMGICVALVLLGFLWWMARSMQGMDDVNAGEELPADATPADALPATTPATTPATSPATEPAPTPSPAN